MGVVREMGEVFFQPKSATCSVCGATINQIHKTGICVDVPLIGSPSYWDYMDCPFCGCQILLRKRLLNMTEIMEEEDGQEE